MHRAWSAIAAITLSCGLAHAQRLNLDAPTAPAPGSNESTRGMRSALRDAVVGSPGDPLPEARLGAAARSRAQAVALALITHGEALGEAGSVHIVCAMTMLADMGWTSELGARAVGPDGEDAAAALRAFVRGVDAALATIRGGQELPDSAAELDVFLRQIFAPLTELVRPEVPPIQSGWVLSDRTRTPPTINELRTRLGAPPAPEANAASLDLATHAAALNLLALLENAGTTWSFAAAAADARATLAGALPLLIDRLPAWFPEAKRQEVAERTAAAIRAYSTSTRDEESAATLATAAGISRLCQWADKLSAGSGHNARDIQSIRLAIADAAAEAVGQVGPARERASKAMRSLERTLDMIDERAVLGTEADVTQSLRTSFRALDAAAKRSESQLVSQIAQIARAESATSQPAIVSVIAAHRRSLDDLRMLRLVDELLTKHRDDQSPTWRLVSSRLTRQGQEVSKPATMEATLLDLRAFASAMELQEPFAGEPAIRAASAGGAGGTAGTLSAWDAETIRELTGNKAAAVMAKIDELRTAYLETWAREGDERRSGGRDGESGGRGANAGQNAEPIASRLRVLRMVCGLIEDMRTVRALAAPEHRARREGLMAWRGLPISAAAAEYLGGGEALSRAVSQAVTQALDASPAATDRARAAVRKLELENVTLRLVARLDREARDRVIVAVPPYASLASPPTRGAWMVGGADARARLAAIARYVDEAAAVATDNPRDAGKIMEYVDMLAGEVGR